MICTCDHDFSQVALKEREKRLCFRVAEADIVLEDPRARGSYHESCFQKISLEWY